MVLQRVGLANLRAEERSPEPIGDGLVRVAIKAVSLNHRDVLVMRGMYDAGASNPPLVPCSDAAGVVIEVGRGVTDVAPGHRVCTHMVPDWVDGPLIPAMRLTTLGGPAPGVLCEERVLSQTALVRFTDALSFEQAACLPVAGLAAWTALTTEASIEPGARILLIGTGGVSLLALQIAKALGAEVAVASSSDEKLARVRGLGADFTVNSRHAGWGELVRRWSAGGVEVVLEMGGDGTFEQSVTATRDGGCIALLGALGQGIRPISLTDVLMRRLRVHGIFVGNRAQLERYVSFVEANALEPVIDRVFEGLSSARHAFAYFLAKRHLGKVVVRVSHA